MSLRGCHWYSWKGNSPRSQKSSGLGTKRSCPYLAVPQERKVNRVPVDLNVNQRGGLCLTYTVDLRVEKVVFAFGCPCCPMSFYKARDTWCNLYAGSPQAWWQKNQSQLLIKDWGFLKCMVFITIAKGRSIRNEVNCNCIQIPWRENACPQLPHQCGSEST